MTLEQLSKQEQVTASDIKTLCKEEGLPYNDISVSMLIAMLKACIDGIIALDGNDAMPVAVAGLIDGHVLKLYHPAGISLQ